MRGSALTPGAGQSGSIPKSLFAVTVIATALVTWALVGAGRGGGGALDHARVHSHSEAEAADAVAHRAPNIRRKAAPKPILDLHEVAEEEEEVARPRSVAAPAVPVVIAAASPCPRVSTPPVPDGGNPAYPDLWGASTSGLAEPWSLSPLWRTRKVTEVRLPLNAGTVRVFSTAFEGFNHFNGGQDWWVNVRPGPDSWEHGTFRVIKTMLTLRPGALIDFGAWIGPTAVFGAQVRGYRGEGGGWTARHTGFFSYPRRQFATRVLALEPDPLAFEQLRGNLMLNPSAMAKSSVYWRCISTRDEELVMRGRGDSMSTSLASKPDLPEVRARGEGSGWVSRSTTPHLRARAVEGALWPAARPGGCGGLATRGRE
jgi:hypothetical protein